MKSIEQLNQENQTLLTQLRSEYKEKDYKPILAAIRANEAQLKTLKREQLVANINKDHQTKRERALKVFNCEIPNEDITCNDGSWHKVKVKKYPNIATLNYSSGHYKDGLLLYIRVDGHKFELYHEIYGNNTKEYKRVESFEDFLSLNKIMVKDITIEEYNELSAKLEALNAKIEEQVKHFEQEIKNLNVYTFDVFGFLEQSKKTFYTYSGKI